MVGLGGTVKATKWKLIIIFLTLYLATQSLKAELIPSGSIIIILSKCAMVGRGGGGGGGGGGERGTLHRKKVGSWTRCFHPPWVANERASNKCFKSTPNRECVSLAPKH